jgi:hypothetical protein
MVRRLQLPPDVVADLKIETRRFKQNAAQKRYRHKKEEGDSVQRKKRTVMASAVKVEARETASEGDDDGDGG